MLLRGVSSCESHGHSLSLARDSKIVEVPFVVEISTSRKRGEKFTVDCADIKERVSSSRVREKRSESLSDFEDALSHSYQIGANFFANSRTSIAGHGSDRVTPFDARIARRSYDGSRRYRRLRTAPPYAPHDRYSLAQVSPVYRRRLARIGWNWGDCIIILLVD